LARIGPSLEGGIIMKTTSAEATYLPAGCIHATFTIKGGYLIAIDFTTMGSVKAFSAYITSDIDCFLGAKDQKDCFDWFSICLDVALVNNRVVETLEAWIDALDRIQDKAGSDSRWRWRIKRIWESFLTRSSFLIPCPCGGMEATQALRAHLEATHLRFLYPKSMATRKHRQLGS
jgi:hypothetical protein